MLTLLFNTTIYAMTGIYTGFLIFAWIAILMGCYRALRRLE
jgi:hypothetical protein